MVGFGGVILLELVDFREPVFTFPYVAFSCVLYFVGFVLTWRRYAQHNNFLLPMVLWLLHRFVFNFVLALYLYFVGPASFIFVVWDYVIELQAIFSILAFFILVLRNGKDI